MCSEVIDALRELRAEIHGKVDEVFVNTLDDAIRELELETEKPRHLARVERLRLLARALEALPSLILLVEKLLR